EPQAALGENALGDPGMQGKRLGVRKRIDPDHRLLGGAARAGRQPYPDGQRERADHPCRCTASMTFHAKLLAAASAPLSAMVAAGPAPAIRLLPFGAGPDQHPAHRDDEKEHPCGRSVLRKPTRSST